MKPVLDRLAQVRPPPEIRVWSLEHLICAIRLGTSRSLQQEPYILAAGLCQIHRVNLTGQMLDQVRVPKGFAPCCVDSGKIVVLCTEVLGRPGHSRRGLRGHCSQQAARAGTCYLRLPHVCANAQGAPRGPGVYSPGDPINKFRAPYLACSGQAPSISDLFGWGPPAGLPFGHASLSPGVLQCSCTSDAHTASWTAHRTALSQPGGRASDVTSLLRCCAVLGWAARAGHGSVPGVAHEPGGRQGRAPPAAPLCGAEPPQAACSARSLPKGLQVCISLRRCPTFTSGPSGIVRLVCVCAFKLLAILWSLHIAGITVQP